MKIFSGSSNTQLTEAICSHIYIDCNDYPIGIGKIKLKSFPSGERYCQFEENIRGEDVFLIQSLCSPVNDHLMELLLMADAARRASADRITAVIPYFGYSRQDRKDKPRVPISAKLVMDLLKASGFNRILTMDLHTPQIGGFTNLPIDHLHFKPSLIKAVSGFKIDVVVAPDVGSIKRTTTISKILKVPMAIVVKERIGASEVEATQFIGDVKGKNVLIVDDLTESAGTLTEAAKMCQENGAIEIYCAITHFCLTPIGLNRLRTATTDGLINRIFCSNSVSLNIDISEIDEFVQIVDVSSVFAKAILNIHNNESVSELFR